MRIFYIFLIGLIILACCLTFLSLFITNGIYLLTHNPKAMDFLAFFTGAKLLSQSPYDLYNLHQQLIMQQHILPITKELSLFIPFVNPPFAILFFMPFLSLGVTNAYIFWTALNVIFLVTICALGYREIKDLRWYFIFCILIGVLTFIPILTALLIGQFSILLALIFLLTWIFLKQDKEFLSGLVLSLLLIKPQYFIVPFIALLFQRRKKVILGLVSGICFLGILSYCLVGTSGIISFLSVLNSAYHGDSRYEPGLMAQHAIQTFFLILFHTKSLTTIQIPYLLSVGVLVVSTVYLWIKRYAYTTPAFSYQFALLILATVVTSPHTHFHDLSILVALPFVLFSSFRKIPLKQQKIIILAVTVEYFIQLTGFYFDVQTQTKITSLWILVSVSSMIILWLLIAKGLYPPKIFNKKKLSL